MKTSTDSLKIPKRQSPKTKNWNFLKKLESDYGLPNLWPYIELDRIIRYNQLLRDYPCDISRYSHEDMIKIIQVTAKAVIKFLEEEKPNAIVFSAIGSIGALLLYEIAKKKNIKTLRIHQARVEIKQILSENYQNFSYANDLFKKLQNNEVSLPEQRTAAIAFLEKFRRDMEPYCQLDTPKARPISRYRQFKFLSPKKILWTIYWWPMAILQYFKNSYRDDYSIINPFWQIWDNLKKKTRVLIGFDDLYDKITPDEDFVFAPLHMEPEIATLLYAPFYKDQLWLTKQMAYSLPLNFKLYIKEHPAMFGLRPRRFYKELKKIPNVKLIRPTAESLPLIKDAKLIITISGTAGWEAIQLKKPVIIFSDAFYSQLPMVKKCVAIEQLPYLIKEQLEKFKHDETALINFLTAIWHESVDVDLVQIWQVEGAGQVKAKKEELSPLADLIASKLNLHSTETE